MAHYVRAHVPGGTFFFTVALLERRQTWLTTHIADLRDAFRVVRTAHPFHIDAVVVLPDHLHCLWTLPPDDPDFSMRWRLIKTRFVRSIPTGERLSVRRSKVGERGIWQRRFWEHAIRDEADYNRHMDYVHYNPVKHGYVSRVADWAHSSFHRYVKLGIYPADWAADDTTRKASFE